MKTTLPPVDFKKASQFDFLSRWVVEKPFLLIFFSLLVLVASGAGLSRLTTVSDARAYFSQDDPMMRTLNTLERVFSKDETAIIVLAPQNKTVFTANALAAIEYVTEKAWEVPFSTRVDSLANYQHTWAKEDDLIVESLVQSPSKMSLVQLEKIKTIALNEPSLAGRIVSHSGHAAGIFVRVTKPGLSSTEDTEITDFVKRIAAEMKEKFPGIDVYLGGDAVFNAGFLEESNEDNARLIPLMFLVMFVVTSLTLRSVWGVFGVICIIISSAVTGAGISGWLGIPMGDVSSIAPIIIMTLAIADSIHILATVFHEMGCGKTKADALRESLRVNLQPVFLTSITTAIGFLSMNLGDSPVFHDLGNMVAIGVIGAFLYSIILLPALIAVLPIKAKAPKQKKAELCDKLATFVVGNRKRLLYLMVGVMVLFSSGITLLEFDDKFIEYMNEKKITRKSAEWIINNLSGLDVMEFVISAGEPGGISEPAYLQNLEKFEQWFVTQEFVTHVTSLNDIEKRLNKTMHGDCEEWYRVPDSRELAAQYLLLYEMSLPFGLELTNQINLDKSASRFTVTISNASSMDIVALEKRANAWIEANLPSNMAARATGLSVMFAHLTENNVKSMLLGTTLALVLISFILVWSLKSITIGIASLLPNLTPAAMSFGLWGFLVGRVGLAVSIVAAMTIGIVVDDTVHFLSKYMRARREHGMCAEEAVRYSFNTVGTAIMITSAILVCGFSVLASSGFLVNAQMGLLTAVTIVFALLTDFLFLPPLLIILEKKR